MKRELEKQPGLRSSPPASFSLSEQHTLHTLWKNVVQHIKRSLVEGDSGSDSRGVLVIMVISWQRREP